MGLDMYAHTISAELVGDQQVDLKLPETADVDELAYWRKFNHLHGWMHDLYKAKGGESEVFNCNSVRLMPEDLDKLEIDLKAGLPHRAGFFFGGEEIYPDDITATEEFIKAARLAIADGEAVYYDSWW